jgi:hypothetical protein
MSKKVSYQDLLKQAIAEFDTSKTVDVKGPMLDPILSWDGGGELPIYKDAASILERYYFNEKTDKGVEVSEMEYNEDGTEKKTPEMEHGEGEGTEQAGTSDEGSMPSRKKEIEGELAKESVKMKIKEQDEKEKEEKEKEDEDEEAMEEALRMLEQEEEGSEGAEETNEMEYAGKDIPKGKKYMKEAELSGQANAAAADVGDQSTDEEEITESIENAVIEKLIAEMEEDVREEKEASGPEEDAQGAGTQQAGTGDDEGQIPDRKDLHDDMVKAKKYTDESKKVRREQDEAEEEAEEAEEEAEEAEEKAEKAEEMDVDKEVKEQIGPPGMYRKMKYEDSGVVEEAFRLFREEIESEDEDEEEKEEKEEEKEE